MRISSIPRLTRHGRLLVAAAVVTGCGGGAASNAATTSSPDTPPPTTATAPASGERAVRVTWSDASGTQRCFFFSGPEVPGAEVRDVHGTSATLREDSGTLSLDFGGGVVFRGPANDARITREESYDYQGKWGITETIVFDVVGDGPWRGRYAYEECATDSNEACPGTCRIEASVSLD